MSALKPTAQQTLSANEIYEEIAAYGYATARVAALAEFIADLVATTKAQTFEEAAEDVECLNSQLPGFDGKCGNDDMSTPEEREICHCCVEAARLRGRAKFHRDSMISKEIPF